MPELDSGMALGAAASPDMLYAVVASPMSSQLWAHKAPPSLPPAPSEVASPHGYTMADFLATPINLLALALGIAGTVASLTLLAIFLVVRSRTARLQRELDARLAADAGQQKQRSGRPVAEVLHGTLVCQPDGSLCCAVRLQAAPCGPERC